MFLASIRQYLSKDGKDQFYFDFLNGPHISPGFPGIERFYRPPFYQYWPTEHTVQDITTARDWLCRYLAENGPYDGIMMFSQGCTLGLSTILLSNETESNHHHRPHTSFKFAIFICGAPSLEELDHFGFTVKPAARNLSEILRTGTTVESNTQLSTRTEDLNSFVTEVLAPLVSGSNLVNIPTVHIIGIKDQLYLPGLQLAGLCAPEKRIMYDHGGGHEIPRSKDASLKIVELVQWAVEQAQLV